MHYLFLLFHITALDAEPNNIQITYEFVIISYLLISFFDFPIIIIVNTIIPFNYNINVII
nr:MAG TPA: hypothetical protein [Caudoviricetes sp.]